jgi:hypothetical protein
VPTWVYGHDPETKQQSSQWKEEPIISMPEEGHTSLFQSEMHAVFFFFLHTWKCALQIHSQG